MSSLQPRPLLPAARHCARIHSHPFTSLHPLSSLSLSTYFRPHCASCCVMPRYYSSTSQDSRPRPSLSSNQFAYKYAPKPRRQDSKNEVSMGTGETLSDAAAARLQEQVSAEQKLHNLHQRRELEEFFAAMNRPVSRQKAQKDTKALEEMLTESDVITGTGKHKYVSSSELDQEEEGDKGSSYWSKMKNRLGDLRHALRWDLVTRRKERITEERQKEYLQEFIKMQQSESQTEQQRILDQNLLFQDSVPDNQGGILITPVGILNFMRNCEDQTHVRNLRKIFHNAYNVYENMFNYVMRARHSHPKVMLLYGYLQYLNQKEPELAFQTIQEAAALNEKEAHHQLSIMYFHGIGTQRNVGMALHYLQSAAQMRCIPAVHQLGLLHRKYNAQKMLAYLKFAAEEGYPEAMYDLGRIYLTGDGVITNYSEAFYWLEEAHKAGDHRAAAQLGLCYANGYGVHKNESLAFSYWTQGTLEGNDVEAIRYLGIAFEQGIGTEKDEELALNAYEIAANNDDVPSMFLVGSCYENGIGTEKNLRGAFDFYIAAGLRQNEDGAAAAIRLHHDEGFELDEHKRALLAPLADPSLLQEIRTMDQVRDIKEKKLRAQDSRTLHAAEDAVESDEEIVNVDEDEIDEEDIEIAEIMENDRRGESENK